MAPPDPRLVIDAAIYANAIHISTFADYARLYGRAADTKMVDGRVTAAT